MMTTKQNETQHLIHDCMIMSILRVLSQLSDDSRQALQDESDRLSNEIVADRELEYDQRLSAKRIVADTFQDAADRVDDFE